jgi:hypothetical protein
LIKEGREILDFQSEIESLTKSVKELQQFVKSKSHEARARKKIIKQRLKEMGIELPKRNYKRLAKSESFETSKLNDCLSALDALNKSIRDKSQLVAVKRAVKRKDGKTFQQTFYVSVEEAKQMSKKEKKPKNKSSINNNPAMDKEKAKQMVSDLRNKIGTTAMIQLAIDSGVTWTRNFNNFPNDYMQMAMAMKKHLVNGGSLKGINSDEKTNNRGYEGLSEGAFKTLRKIEKKTATQPFEHGYFVDTDGKQIYYQTDNHPSQIVFTDITKKGYMNGNIFTHNHPRGTSLSIDDLIFGMFHKAKEIRAVGVKDGVMRIYRFKIDYNSAVKTAHSKGLSIDDYIDDMYLEIKSTEDDVRSDFTNRIYDGKMSVSDAEFNHTHEIWTKMMDKGLLKKYHVEYERIENV